MVFSCLWDSLVYYTLWTVFMIVFTRINVALFVTYNYPIGWSITHQITRRSNGGLPQRWGTTEKMKLVELLLGAQNLLPTYDAGFSGPVMQVFKLNPEPGCCSFKWVSLVRPSLLVGWVRPFHDHKVWNLVNSKPSQENDGGISCVNMGLFSFIINMYN